MVKLEETSMGAIFQNRVQEHGDKTLVKYNQWHGEGHWHVPNQQEYPAR
jgi:hypothetical protein